MGFGFAPAIATTFFADKERDASSPSIQDHILLETGDDILLENGDYLLKE